MVEVPGGEAEMNSRGMTTIELLVVVAFMVNLAAILFPLASQARGQIAQVASLSPGHVGQPAGMGAVNCDLVMRWHQSSLSWGDPGELGTPTWVQTLGP